MESNYHEEQEVVVVDDLGVGRSYECVFCKRGFNTAQALGGHMNIHRKHRATTKQDMSRFYYHHTPPPPPPSSSSYRLFPHHPHFPPNTTTCFPPPAALEYPQPQPSSHVIPVDWRMSHDHDVGKKKKRLTSVNQQHKELDLELRLGYD